MFFEVTLICIKDWYMISSICTYYRIFSWVLVRITSGNFAYFVY